MLNILRIVSFFGLKINAMLIWYTTLNEPLQMYFSSENWDRIMYDKKIYTPFYWEKLILLKEH